MTAAARPGGAGRRLLAASLALNVFLLGFAAVRIASRHAATDRDGATAFFHRVLPRLVSSLPPADGKLLGEALAARAAELEARRDRLAGAVARVRASIAASPYDDARVRSDVAAAREARRELSGLVVEAVVAVLPRMSSDGRRALASFRVGQLVAR